MKRISSGLLLLGAVFLLSGCGSKPAGTNQSDAGASKEVSGGNSTFHTFEEVKDAISGGKKLECTYKSKGENGSAAEFKTVMDGGKSKSVFEINGEKMYTVFDGETMYSWGDKTKKGTKISLACLQEATKDLPKNENAPATPQSGEDSLKNAMDISCQPVSLVDLSIPSDIIFTDTCEQMKQSLEMMKNLKGNLPKGVNIPTSAN